MAEESALDRAAAKLCSLLVFWTEDGWWYSSALDTRLPFHFGGANIEQVTDHAVVTAAMADIWTDAEIQDFLLNY